MKGLKVLGVIGGIILSTFFGLLLFGFVSGYALRNFLTVDTLETTVKSIEIDKITVVDLGLNDFKAKYGDVTLESALIKELGEFGFEEKKAKELLNDASIKSFIAEVISDAVTSISEKKPLRTIAKKEVAKVLENTSFNEEDIQGVTDYLNEMIGQFNKGGYDERHN